MRTKNKAIMRIMSHFQLARQKYFAAIIRDAFIMSQELFENIGLILLCLAVLSFSRHLLKPSGPPRARRKSGYRKAGVEITPPSDMSAAIAELCNDSASANVTTDRFGARAYRLPVDVVTNAPFFGVAVVECVRLVPPAELIGALTARAAAKANQSAGAAGGLGGAGGAAVVHAASAQNGQPVPPPPPPPPKQCAVCQSPENLMRCSRCKAAWYCSSAHQVLRALCCAYKHARNV